MQVLQNSIVWAQIPVENLLKYLGLAAELGE